MEKKGFDTTLARDHCMQYGMVVGLLCSASFLCSMYGLEQPILGLVGNLLGMVAFVSAGVLIRQYARSNGPLTFARRCYMALLTYCFAIMVTAVVQYVYFRFLDNGLLAMQLRTMLALPEYRQAITQMTGEEEVEQVVEQVVQVTQSPRGMTLQLLGTNMLISLFLLLPTALMAGRGQARANHEE